MGTKANPGECDCYARALLDEPLFTLLGRDPDAPALVRLWAVKRSDDIAAGKRPRKDLPMVREAMALADAMEEWRIANEGKWRDPASA